ncbi:HNH endonuclease signature motif containing protein [Methylobacterium sp. WL7]|uniref:HNH endonuclease n=1 Tax=Methylobacterium sp. WL7 TaxID=2603900 RepID=UPI0011C75A4C|nr:HNH endonuclease signature motif containing protein [Methylobacterium sp. WL7]TXN42533.1 HNH endonuclease [Methylobacterium sp. WL7]
MPFVVPEDVGTTQRRSLSGRRRLQAWERTAGTCVICGQRIDGVRERWIVEHIRALELGGTDDIENMGPAHEACGREKTRDDHARAAEAKRQKIRHLGAVVVTRPLPGSRGCALKRKINGTVVLREAPDRAPADNKSRSRQWRAVSCNTKRFPVDAAMEPKDRLCLRPKPSAKENEAGTANQMANRPTTVKPKNADERVRNSPASGEILPAIPAHLDFLFADRPLLPGDNEEQYDALLRSIVQQVEPADVIEAIWVKDIIDLIWEAKRLRRWRGQILVQAQLKAVEELIKPGLQGTNVLDLSTFGGPSAEYLAAGWMAGDEIETERVEEILQKRGLKVEDVRAHGFLMNLPAIERIDRLSLSADQRRDALVREIERKRASFAQQVRTATADVIDADDAHIS